MGLSYWETDALLTRRFATRGGRGVRPYTNSLEFEHHDFWIGAQAQWRSPGAYAA